MMNLSIGLVTPPVGTALLCRMCGGERQYDSGKSWTAAILTDYDCGIDGSNSHSSSISLVTIYAVGLKEDI
ncbi:hypothetical protein [Photobacterium sp. DNB22_13_2]